MEEPESLTSAADLADLDEQPGFDLNRVDISLLSSPVVSRALAGITVATLVLIWPGRTDRILARLIALAVLLLASTSLWSSLKTRPRDLIQAALTLPGLIAGVALLVSPNQSETVLARLVGVGFVVVGLRDLGGLLTDSPDPESRVWIVMRSIALGGSGAVLLLFPTELFAAATTIAALGWIALSLVVIGVSLDAGTSGVTNYGDSARLIGDWLAGRPKSVDDRRALYDKILYEGPATQPRVIRFFTLMGFASVIASMGVMTDSTAVVIGAMLIAPLMTPLMGMAISLVMGWPHRLGRSTLVAGSGIVLSIGLGMALGLGVPAVIDTVTNSQITARSSPTVLDLGIALAAGAAGAYGLSRPDVSDSLPGVAIAISLVPPLSVVGVAYSQGDWHSGNGALLLFATNMLAILVMGGITFVATGVAPIRQVAENQHRVRTASAAVAALGALVIGALLLNGTQIASDLLDQSSTGAAVDDWLDDYPQHSLIRVDLDGDTITATIVGPSTGAPTAASLAAGLGQALDRTVTADLRLIVEERYVATSTN